jgi:hypothetical protein
MTTPAGNKIPPPSHTASIGAMPGDIQTWLRQLHLSNFVNAYYHLRDIERLGSCRRVLIVGPGQGLGVEVLKWRGFEVTTFDVDPAITPDVCGSVHDMRAFADGQFDVVVVSHVLEHLPATMLDGALSEMARVAQFALLYVPKHGVHVQAKVATNFYDRSWNVIVNFFNYFSKTDGLTPRYMSGQHFWELGIGGFRVRDFRRRPRRHFRIVSEYRNPDWPVSYNFVLERSSSHESAVVVQ